MQQVDDHLGDLRHELEGFDTDHEKKFLEVRHNLHSLEIHVTHVTSKLLLRMCRLQATAVVLARWSVRY